MLQQIFSGSFNFYDVVAYLVAVLLIIFLIFAVSRVGARFCCVFTRRQRGKKSWQINAQSYKPY